MVRTGIRFGCNGIRQISSRRFVTRQRIRSNQIHFNGLSYYDRACRFIDLSKIPTTPISLVGFGIWWFLAREASQERKETDESLRKRMEIRGLNREYLEAKIANIKQNIESGSATDSDRSDLKTYKECLQVFTRGA